jgi:hypothetical protein
MNDETEVICFGTIQGQLACAKLMQEAGEAA